MFYIHHPRCRVPLHIVEDCVLTRLQYLKLLYEDKANDFDGRFEYLFENTVYDNIGHFTLRLITSISRDLHKYWLIRERKLLRHRLDHLLPRQIHSFFRKILRHVKTYEHDDNSVFIKNALIIFSTHFLQPQVFEHIVDKKHKNDCKLHSCKINFQSVPDLVRKRKIDLINGYAIVSCSMWKQVLESLLNTLIEHEYNYSNCGMKSIVQMDPRLYLLYEKIQRQIIGEGNCRGTITAANINIESKKFPLCMQHLHRVLRDRHRLSHYARFYYSLFLKECGMELENAINYWQIEYSKPHTCSSGCTHDWQTNEKKFLYSIRHLYGLEGGRKQYSAPKCEMIGREIPGPRYEGGCPFKNFDRTTLNNLLSTWPIADDIKQQLIGIGKDEPGVACGLFQKIINNTEKEIIINSPVQYYSNIIKLSDQR